MGDWKTNIDRISERLKVGDLSRKEAMAEWMNLGLDDDEAEDFADEAMRKIIIQRYLAGLWIVVALGVTALFTVLYE
ncbi:MAG: hypothetical protein V3U60_16565 [Gammaproteobacteria bacterium]